MLKIVFKDIYQLRKSIVIYIIIGLFLSIFGIKDNNMSMIGISTFLIVYSVVAQSEFYEDKNRGYYFLKTLPIKRYKIVVSKFITTLILAAAGSLFGLTAALVLGDSIVFNQVLKIILMSLGISLNFAGTLYVLSYKMGALKAINITRYLFITFAFIPLILSSLLKPLFSQEQLIRIIQILDNFNIIQFFVLMIIIYMFLMFLSIKVFYKSK